MVKARLIARTSPRRRLIARSYVPRGLPGRSAGGAWDKSESQPGDGDAEELPALLFNAYAEFLARLYVEIEIDPLFM